MNRIKNKLKYIIPIIILIIFGIFFVYYYLNNKDVVLADGLIKNEIKKVEEEPKKEEIKEEIIDYVYVDIKGAVNSPNVYKIPENSRVIDVINAASGLREDADTSIINLSKKVKDEMFIIIYTKDEINKYKEKSISTNVINKELNNKILVIDENNDAKIDKKDNITSEEKKNEQKEEKKNEKVNINTASKDELLSITGIGESKAVSIISYREKNGNFSSIEDIKNVSGIGDALFEKIKDYITV